MAQYSGPRYTAGTSGLQMQFRKNRMYVENLKRAIGSVGKQMTGLYAAQALHNVVMTTIKDSGRAAANWNLNIGSTMATQEWNPKNYEETYNEGLGPVGKRGDRNRSASDTNFKKSSTAAEQVAYYKGFYYGYTISGNGVELIPNDKIWKALKIGEPGPIPAISLYNPIFSPANPQYSKHAFGADINLDGNGKQTVPLDSMAASAMPKLLRKIAAELKAGKKF